MNNERWATRAKRPGEFPGRRKRILRLPDGRLPAEEELDSGLASRYLQEKWDKASYQEHRRKVELAVPVVNTTALLTPLHLHINLKKMQLEKERQVARDRDNLLHYARLGRIKQSQGRVDNWNFYCGHSLNWEKRQRDLEQIYRENRQLLKRLAEKKSELAQGRWQQDWHRGQLIRNSLSHYPRATKSCQAETEQRRQRTGDSSSSSPGGSPHKSHFLVSGTRPRLVGERFWRSRNESAPEGQVTTTAFSLPVLRRRNASQPLGPSAQWSCKGVFVPAKDFSTNELDGSSARPNLPGRMSIEKPVAEVAVPRTKRPP